METQSSHSQAAKPPRLFARGRILTLSACILTLAACIIYSWFTRDALAQLNFLRQQNKKHAETSTHRSIVSTEPWQTAQTLLPMAKTAEEQEYAREAIRLSDHDVDQAFAEALRMANMHARHGALTGDAQINAQKVKQLEQTVRQDQQQVAQLGGEPSGADTARTNAEAAKANTENALKESDELQLARAQLSLDSGELSDARQMQAQLTGDHSDEIQQELSAYHLSQQQAENSAQSTAERAVTSAQQRRTLLMRIQSWRQQNERAQLLKQAAAQAAAEQTSLAAERASTQQSLSQSAANAAASGGWSQLEQLKDKSYQRQILSILDDRIQTDQQLAAVYQKWIAQVALQHRIVLHMIVQSLAWIIVILVAVILLDALMQHLLEHPALDNRQARTLRAMVRLAVQVAGAVAIMLIVFGVPQQLSTMLGLTTAALTIALQDFILAFFGWFLLVGRNGIRVGDWVEINSVNGEVVEVGLFNTTLLELGSLSGKGHPTGRRISFVNSFAIRGQYFNFSTSGQWMWDEVSIGVPKTLDVHQAAAEIEQLVREKTDENARAAERDWSRVARGSSLTRLAASSSISLRPTVDGIEVTVHYVTRATERYATRDSLYLQLLALLQAKQAQNAKS